MNLGASLGGARQLDPDGGAGDRFRRGAVKSVLADVSADMRRCGESASFITSGGAGGCRSGEDIEQVDAVCGLYRRPGAALKAAFAVVALGALVSLWYVRRLPTKAGTGDPEDVPPPAGEAAPVLSG
jgi:hypothetical protein